MDLKIAIVGCGLVGRKRASGLAPGQVHRLFDVDGTRSRALAAHLGRPELVAPSLEAVLSDPDVTAVIVATANDALAPIALESVRAGKHVLVEKPGARSWAELCDLTGAAKAAGVCLRIGYNHRYHPAVLKARELLASAETGPIFMLRGRYGHGGRPGYDREWRADPAISGGGELIDQGVHLIDLAGAFLGDLRLVHGRVYTYFWRMPVDDNAFLHLEDEQGHACWLHASCTEWKNMFSLELYCRDAKLQIDGLGGSYGVERLTHYRMLPEMGPPETTIYEYPRGDESWNLEIREFLEDIRLGRAPVPGPREGLQALRIVDEVYRASGGERA